MLVLSSTKDRAKQENAHIFLDEMAQQIRYQNTETMEVLAFARKIVSPSPKKLDATIAAQNGVRERRFLEFVQQAGWRVLKWGDRHTPANSIVIGVAIWSEPDMKGLKSLAQRKPCPTGVHIFSMDEIQTIEDAKHFMLGTPTFTQTPVFAEYREGTLQRFLEGREALDWMAGEKPKTSK